MSTDWKCGEEIEREAPPLSAQAEGGSRGEFRRKRAPSGEWNEPDSFPRPEATVRSEARQGTASTFLTHETKSNDVRKPCETG